MNGAIIDGTGKGYGAAVNDRHQLSVISESLQSEGYQAQLGRSFIIHAECHLAATATGGLIHIMNNDPDHDMEVTRLYVDAQSLTMSDLILTQWFDSSAVNGTDVSDTAVVQKDRNDVTQFNLTVKASDAASDLTLSGGVKYHAFPITSMSTQQRNMNGTNRLPAGKTLAFGFKRAGGGNAVDGEVVSFSINVIKRDRT